MFAILQPETLRLDYGIVGFSAERMLLIFLLILAVPMIPYLFLYISLRKEEAKESLTAAPAPPKPQRKFAAWLHGHKHPELLHH